MEKYCLGLGSVHIHQEIVQEFFKMHTEQNTFSKVWRVALEKLLTTNNRVTINQNFASFIIYENAVVQRIIRT